MSYLIAFIYGAALFYIYKFFPFTSILISLVLLLSEVGRQKAEYRLKRGKKDTGSVLRLLSSVLCALSSAAGFYYAQFSYAPVQPYSDVAGKVIEVRGTARSEAARVNPGTDAFSQIVGIKHATDEAKKPLNLKELRLISPVALLPGEQYLIKVRIPGNAYFLNPGAYDRRLSGYAAGVEVDRSKPEGNPAKDFFGGLRARLNKGIKDNFSGESAPFLMSIITGERGLLPGDMNNAFNVTGLAHILSISGSHFGLLLLVLFGLFRSLVKMAPYGLLYRLTLYITPSQLAATLCMPFMIAYLGISDMSPPAIRSFIMIMLFLFGLLIQRKGFWLNTVLLAAAIIIAIQPDSILDLSFQLSFIAVLCIGIAADKRYGGPENRGHREPEATDHRKRGLWKTLRVTLPPIRRFVASSLRISLAATLGTTPLVAFYFHYFSLVSPLTNLIITPAIGFIVLPSALASSCVFLMLGEFPLHALISGITDFILDSIKYIAQWDFVDIKIPAFPPAVLIAFYCGALFYVIHKYRNGLSVMSNELKNKDSSSLSSSRITDYASRSLAVAVLPIVIYTGIRLFEHKGIRITYLDVGQGDAAVVELPDNRALVIDTGRNGLQSGEFLRYRGIKKIEAVVLSHGQVDHAGGTRYLIENFRISEVWDNSRLVYPEGLLKDIRHRGLRRGDVISGSGYAITVLHPYDGFYVADTGDTDENNDSLVLKIQGRRNAFLFTGDIEKAAGENMAYLGGHLKSTVFKVPHHGSRSSVSEAFYRAVSPGLAVISLGRKNPYGHPHEEALEALRNAKVFRTDRDGAIGIRETADGKLEVETWREFRFSEAHTASAEVVNLKKLFLVW